MKNSKIRPGYLRKGDEVGIISPSFCIDEEKLVSAAEFLSRWGLKVRIGRNAAKRFGPFAGTDEERLADFQEMTNDPAIRAILCSRGGYGLSRIVDRVDFSPLKRKPKWYAGFSDITVLHMWLSEVESIESIHSDMPLHYYDPEKTEETFSTLKKALFGDHPEIEWEGPVVRQADVAGEVTGGNLSIIYSLIGTPAEPDTKGKILFIEEVGEYYYHLDRMLTSLRLAGKLDDLAALVIGGMNKIEDTRIPWGKTVEETVAEVVARYDYPVFFNFPAGHIADNRAFYIGRRATISLDGTKAILSYR
jgi:muramoyltetrapeptide carboxypeptidase